MDGDGVQAWPDGRDAATESTVLMDPVDALERIATLLERERAGRYKEEAFRKAADAIRARPVDELRAARRAGPPRRLPGIGSSTGRVIEQALDGEVPEYLARLEAEAAPDAGPGAPIRAALKGDLHLHSDWSDGGATIEQMARKAAELGHEYLALTDHSPRYVAQRPRRRAAARRSSSWSREPQRGARAVPHPHRHRGRHPRGRRPRPGRRPARRARRRGRERALEAAHERAADDRPHGRGDGEPAHRHPRPLHRPHGAGQGPSGVDVRRRLVFGVCTHFDKAVEINCRPERLDPPMRLLEQVVATGCKVSIDSDAHAVGQLEWQPYGCARAAERRGRRSTRSSTPGPSERLLEWTAVARRVSSVSGSGRARGRPVRYHDDMSEDPRWLAVLAATTATTSCTRCARAEYSARRATSRRPRPDNVAFFRRGTEAEDHGYRACRRCRPDAPASDERVAGVEAACRRLDATMGAVADVADVSGCPPTPCAATSNASRGVAQAVRRQRVASTGSARAARRPRRHRRDVRRRVTDRAAASTSSRTRVSA